ncbi:MAG: Nif3-like dinuclear metal center hexameric protein [Eubacteriales bacterium]
MPCIKDIIDLFDTLAPRSLSAPWDNDGVMVCKDYGCDVSRVLVALDLTPEVMVKALGGYELVITHHPLLFGGLRSINPDGYIPRMVLDLLDSNISLLSYHTRLDGASGGVNDVLCSLLELEDVKSFGNADCPSLCRIGSVRSPLYIGDFTLKAKHVLACPNVDWCGVRTVSRVAVCGGAGKDFLKEAVRQGADTFFTGELGYNTMLDTSFSGMNIVCAGHFHTEKIICNRIKGWLASYFPELMVDIADSGSCVGRV